MSDDNVDLGRDPFEFVRGDQYLTVRFFGDLDGDIAKDFEKRGAAVFAENALDIVFDCDLLRSFQPAWIRPLLAIVNGLKPKKKGARFIHVNEQIRQFFIEGGVAASLVCVPSLPIALRQLGHTSGRKLDVKFINPFLTSTAEIISMQTQSVVKAGMPYLKDAKLPFGGDISGVIGLLSDHFNGTVIISFPEATYCKILSKMLGETFTELTPEIQDGAAEMTNMIFGKAKILLNEQGYGLKMAIPTVISGKNHSIQSKSTGPRVAIPYESEFGPFAVEISLNE